MKIKYIKDTNKIELEIGDLRESVRIRDLEFYIKKARMNPNKKFVVSLT